MCAWRRGKVRCELGRGDAAARLSEVCVSLKWGWGQQRSTVRGELGRGAGQQRNAPATIGPALNHACWRCLGCRASATHLLLGKQMGQLAAISGDEELQTAKRIAWLGAAAAVQLLTVAVLSSPTPHTMAARSFSHPFGWHTLQASWAAGKSRFDTPFSARCAISREV